MNSFSCMRPGFTMWVQMFNVCFTIRVHRLGFNLYTMYIDSTYFHINIMVMAFGSTILTVLFMDASKLGYITLIPTVLCTFQLRMLIQTARHVDRDTIFG